MVTVYVMNISQVNKISPEEYKKVFPLRWENAQKFIRYEEGLRRLAVGALLYRVTGIEEKELSYNRYGKPYCPSKPPFSVSHSGNYAVLAADAKPIGVDIESTKRECLKIMPRVFTPEEIAFVGEDKERFFTLWTLKEGLAKAIGVGLSLPLRQICVLPLLQGNCICWQGEEWFGQTEKLDGGEYIVSCVTKQKESIKIERLELDK